MKYLKQDGFPVDLEISTTYSHKFGRYINAVYVNNELIMIFPTISQESIKAFSDGFMAAIDYMEVA